MSTTNESLPIILHIVHQDMMMLTEILGIIRSDGYYSDEEALTQFLESRGVDTSSRYPAMHEQTE